MSDRSRTSGAFPGTPPQSGRDWYEQARAQQQAGNLAAALDSFRESLNRAPRVAAAWIGLAEVLDANQQPLDALECLKRACAAEPLSVVAATRHARSLQELGRVEEARRAYDRALAIDADSAAALMGLGELLEDQGDPQGAATAYRKVLSRHPERADALANLLGLGRSVDISEELALAESRLDDADLRDRALIGYGLGKALDRLSEHDRAFSALQTANRARREAAGAFDRSAFDERVRCHEEIFSDAFFASRGRWGDSSAVPVFIVGLPRSGTTLTEQVLGTHPSCFGAGELGILADLATGTPDRLGRSDPPWPHCAPELNQEQVNAIGAELVAYLESRAASPDSTALRIVDKQPLNFWHLGLVALALPKARIIHCTRDLRDNGFSIYAQNFNPGQRWAVDLDDIAYYWRGYRRLMAHWQKVTGLEVLEVRYEDTVADLEAQGRRLLDFLELPWDPAVLDFHKSNRAVQTPSRWQVRQPIYQDSAAKWRRYDRCLEPLHRALRGEGVR